VVLLRTFAVIAAKLVHGHFVNLAFGQLTLGM